MDLLLILPKKFRPENLFAARSRNPRKALLPLSLLIFLVLSCNLAREEGRTFIQVETDTAWAAFDSLEITWTDTVSGSGGALYSGNPADLSETDKLPADGYDGGKIVVTFKGYRDKSLVYEERRGFDGGDPGSVSKEIVAIDTQGTVTPGDTVAPGSRTPRLTRIEARPDTLVSIGDSIAFSATARLDSGSLKEYAWSYEGGEEPFAYGEAAALDGHPNPAAITGGHRYAEPGTYQVALKVVSDADSFAVARLRVRVLRDPPAADAGRDTAVYPMATVRLHGAAKDGLGTVVRTEWKIGDGEFAASAADTAFEAPAATGDLTVLFRVTDDDGQTAIDTLIVHVIPENVSFLTDLRVSVGTLSPRFSPGILEYSDTVPNGAASIVLTPEGGGTIEVNGVEVGSGEASDPIDLAVGDNAVTVVVRNGAAAARTYSLNVHRLPPSVGADLKELSLSAGTLDPEFSPEATVYTIAVENPFDSTLVTATAASPAATLSINKRAAQSGVGFPVKIPTGVSVITVAVTTPEGSVKTYSILVTREKNGNADLSALIPSAGTLRPAFDRNTTAYTLEVGNDAGAGTPFTLAPETSAPTSGYTVTVNGVVVESFDPETPIPLRVGPNTVEIKVRAENGDVKTYGLSVTRARNGNADLSGLGVSPGALDPSFRSGDTAYAVAVGNATTLITVTAVAAASTSAITVDGKPVTGGEASEAIALKVGENVISVTVTAENGAIRTYSLAVTRARSGNALLSGLVPSAGTLVPAFQSGVTDYSFQAAFADSLVRITPTAADSLAVIQVNGDALASGAASQPLKVQVGPNPNRFIVVVTAENQAQKAYNVSVDRLPSSQSTLKSLTVSKGTLVKLSAQEYADTVSHGVTSVTLTPVAADANATITVNSAAVANGSASAPIPLAVGDNDVSCEVTAQDGKTKTRYTIHVTRPALLIRNRKLGSAASVLDSAEMLLGRPYQQSAPAVTGFRFVEWSTLAGRVVFADSTAQSTTVTLPQGDARIQARYDTNTYTLTVSALHGTVGRNPNQPDYVHGESVILTVTPAAGYRFSSWSDGNTANPRTITMVANTTLTATCTAIPRYDLTLAASPSGSGSVSADPSGGTYYSGTAVKLTPVPATGYHFVNWTGDLTGSADPGSVSMTADKTVTAHFAPDHFDLTVNKAAGSGCTTTPSGTVQVVNGAPTTITATSCKQSVAACPTGAWWIYYNFSGWSAVSGDPVFGNARSATTTVTLSSGDAAILANYATVERCE